MLDIRGLVELLYKALLAITDQKMCFCWFSIL